MSHTSLGHSGAVTVVHWIALLPVNVLLPLLFLIGQVSFHDV